MEFLKSIGGKLVTGLVALVVIAAAVSWFQASPESRERWVATFARGVGWSLLVLALPWASFLLITAVARTRSNLAGAAFVYGMTAVEVLILGWLFDWTIHGTLGWVFAVAGVLIAGVYNLFACDWIAERLE
jgi:hypothetical protein